MRRLENISLLFAMLLWSLGAVTAFVKVVRRKSKKTARAAHSFGAICVEASAERCGDLWRSAAQVRTRFFLNAASNRDPQRFHDPERLDLKRANNSHLALGAGVCFCVGSQLARLEGQVRIRKLIQKFLPHAFAQRKRSGFQIWLFAA